MSTAGDSAAPYCTSATTPRARFGSRFTTTISRATRRSTVDSRLADPTAPTPMTPIFWRMLVISSLPPCESHSAGPPGPTEISPGTACRVAFRMQNLRTRVLRGIELKDHPLWIRNSRIRGRIELPDVIAREREVDGADVVLELLEFPGSDDHAADSGPTEYPCDRDTRRAGAMPCGHFLQRIHDAVAHLSVERHELARIREAGPGRRWIVAAVLARQEPAGQRAPHQDADVVVLGERLELVLEAPAHEAVIHLRRDIFLQPQALLQHDRGRRLP